MTYRVIQWSTGNVGRHAAAPASRAIPTSSSSACGCTARTRPGATRASSSASSPPACIATNDVDALLALDADCVCYTATADLRPAEAIDDMARIAGVGQEHRVELGRAARATRRTSQPDDAQPARRRVRDAAGVSCFTSGIDPGWANDLLPLVLTGTCEYIDDAARDGDRQLRDLRAADGAVRHDGLRPAARRDAAAADPRRAVVRVGRHGEGARRRARRRDRRAARGPRTAARAARRSTSVSASSKKGTTAAMRFEVQGIVDGEPRIVLEHVTRLDDDARARLAAARRATAATASSSPATRATRATCR